MATEQRRVISARVAQSNTPESDAMPEVLHVVSGTGMDGSGDFAVKVMAKEPLHALELVRKMPQAEFEALERVKEEV